VRCILDERYGPTLDETLDILPPERAAAFVSFTALLAREYV
jgi:hypothetical protein